MTLEYIVIIGLAIAVFLMVFMVIGKNKSVRVQLAKQKNDCNLEFDNYRKQVKRNLEDTISSGELQILRTLLKLFEDSSFHNLTVYHQLEYERNNLRKKLDFLVVSNKGIYVIESKKWKGTTYIYRQECHDLFDNTMFDSFGVGSNKAIRVFNAKRSDDNQNQILLSPYTNPIAQARGYSRDLREILQENASGSSVPNVKNIITFHTGDDYKVIIDNHLLQSNLKIDEYTRVISDSHIKDFFTSRADSDVDSLNVNELLHTLLQNHSIQCNFKVDANNYMEAPFSLV